ncbi:hypothetical protein RchiOBHm_Chr7g0216311 [Rosa chinensis]|uniref:Uncharacterized protein n=1 Tax=Rosa chinensis TaxID=74649 RepID=A0A2P6PBN9_ROSCH|nr:hypothetical protein RchiOBHm_Chr7g0216311 [Rosa chinensis]
MLLSITFCSTPPPVISITSSLCIDAIICVSPSTLPLIQLIICVSLSHLRLFSIPSPFKISMTSSTGSS